jgi:very-short-patch-repair endonuclease
MSWPSIMGQHWARAREMRKQSTRAEKLLWHALRNNQLQATFRRQHPIGPFIVDFVCNELMLIIEVDGDVHAKPDQQDYDQIRQRALESLGYAVLRFSNSDVLQNLNSVLANILTEIESHHK